MAVKCAEHTDKAKPVCGHRSPVGGANYAVGPLESQDFFIPAQPRQAVCVRIRRGATGRATRNFDTSRSISQGVSSVWARWSEMRYEKAGGVDEREERKRAMAIEVWGVCGRTALFNGMGRSEGVHVCVGWSAGLRRSGVVAYWLGWA